MITSSKYFVHPSEKYLDIDSSSNMVEVVLPTSEAMSNYISKVGGLVPEVISFKITGATIHPVRFYRGGGLFWNDGSEYIEITTDGNGTISSQSGIQSIVNSTSSSSGGNVVSGSFSRLSSASSGTLTINTPSKAKMIFFNANITGNNLGFSDGKSDGVINNCVGGVYDGKSNEVKNSQTYCIGVLSLVGGNTGWAGVVSAITNNSFTINFTKISNGLDIDVQWMAQL